MLYNTINGSILQQSFEGDATETLFILCLRLLCLFAKDASFVHTLKLVVRVSAVADYFLEGCAVIGQADSLGQVVA